MVLNNFSITFIVMLLLCGVDAQGQRSPASRLQRESIPHTSSWHCFEDECYPSLESCRTVFGTRPQMCATNDELRRLNAYNRTRLENLRIEVDLQRRFPEENPNNAETHRRNEEEFRNREDSLRRSEAVVRSVDELCQENRSSCEQEVTRTFCISYHEASDDRNHYDCRRTMMACNLHRRNFMNFRNNTDTNNTISYTSISRCEMVLSDH